MPKQVFSHNDYQLGYYVTGNGPAIVMVHGFPFDHQMWRPQIEALQSSGRVIAPDLRGFGESTLGAADVSQGVEMAEYAADVKAIMDHASVDQPVILCGFSMGGYVLWQCLKQFPERIRGIVLCDTKATADAPEAAAGRIKMADSVVSTGPAPVADAMLPKLLAASTWDSSPEVVEQAEAMIHECDPAAIAAAQRGMARRPDVTADLPAINLPALVIVGVEDAISTPQEMGQIVRALPNATLVEVPSAGHMTTLENPAVVNEALLAFVAELSG